MCRTLFALSSLMFVLVSCASGVKISSFPKGADVYADGVYVGQTPMRYQDAKVSGESLEVVLEHEGHMPIQTEITKDARLNVKALIASPLVVPLIWILAYPRKRHFHMKPIPKLPSEESTSRRMLMEVQSTSALGQGIHVVALHNEPCGVVRSDAMLETTVGIHLMQAYQVLERRGLPVVSDESRRHLSGAHDEASVVRAGKLAGAKGVVLVSATCREGNELVSLKMVDSETGALHWAMVAENEPLEEVMQATLKRLHP